jgi:chromosome segregation ATPase
MLSHSVGVLRSQREHVRRQKHYEEAYKAGIKWEQGKFGDPLVEEVRAQVKEGKWRRALRGVLVLLRYYPQGLALLFMERRRLARRLEASKRKLETRERYLEELEDTQKESKSALAREREEVQRLRKRIGRLEQRIQDLNRQAKSGLRPRIRRLSKKILSRF